jgi:hypothetical protein
MIHIATITLCWSSIALEQIKEGYKMEPQDDQTDVTELPLRDNLRYPKDFIIEKATYK